MDLREEMDHGRLGGGGAKILLQKKTFVQSTS